MSKMRGHIAARRSCPIHGDNGCENQDEAGAVTRAQEKREWRKDLGDSVASPLGEE